MAAAPGSRPAPDLVPRALRHTYLRTHLTIELEGEVLPAPAVAQRAASPIYIVSAANPRSCPTDAAENSDRHQTLVDIAEEAGLSWTHARGSDPHSDWAEPSLALFHTSLRQARKLGRRLEQYAVFEVTGETVAAHGCLSRWALARTHGEPALPENDDTLADALARAYDLEIAADLKRFRHRGWRPVGSTELACSMCSAHTSELFSVVHQQKRGSIVEHLAVVCLSCGEATPTTGLPAALQTTTERWRDYLLAVSDAADSGITSSEYRCYVVRLDAADDRWVYVGQSSKPPEARLAEHLAGGAKASKIVARHGVDLRVDLMTDLPVFADRLAAETYERYLAAKLHLKGFEVAGGH